MPSIDVEIKWRALPAILSTPLGDAPSGRQNQLTICTPDQEPWIVGTWPADSCKVVDCDQVRVVFLGTVLDSPPRILSLLAKAIKADRLDQLSRLPGSYYTLISTPHYQQYMGDIAGLRRIFYADSDKGVVVANQAHALWWLNRGSVDKDWLVLQLLLAGSPAASRRRTAFTGVQCVPEGEHIQVMPDGVARIGAYWEPIARLATDEAAERLAETLGVAVSGRLKQAGSVSCDLSGGLDSTSIASLVSNAYRNGRYGREPIFITAPALSPLNDDPRYAQVAAENLDGRHIVIHPDRYPTMYENIEQLPFLDEPIGSHPWLQRTRYRLQLATESGSELHLTGHGGDELLGMPMAYFQAMVRDRPVDGLRNFSKIRRHYKLPLWPTIKGLTDGTPYGEWLASGAGRLLRQGPSNRGDPVAALHGKGNPMANVRAAFGWEVPLRFPPWVTPDAAALAAEVVTKDATLVGPLAMDRGMHWHLHNIHFAAHSMDAMARATSNVGLQIAFPFMDRDVVDTCTAADPAICASPLEYKGLLQKAMRGTVASDVLGRPTKAHYNTEAYVGFEKKRRVFEALIQESLLAEEGIIDRECLALAFRSMAAADSTLVIPIANATFSCELWLRSQMMSLRTPVTE